MEYFFTCPYCWQEISIILDTSEKNQTYIEDCENCCNPINISFILDEDKVISFEAKQSDE